MSYKRIRLLIVHDPGLCARVVPRMKEMLENRAFEVDVQPYGSAVDLSPYKGVILGSGVRGLGIRGDTPSEGFQKFVAETEGLDEKKAAIFAVYLGKPGKIIEKMQAAVEARGTTVVVSHPYWILKPDQGEHVLPAECMVRIR